ncbi:MAG: DNA-binding CsgD family transcriptional regulator [Myxococcota bacterium]|jgi:DNA-binding CsgD family transcriptional regulator
MTSPLHAPSALTQSEHQLLFTSLRRLNIGVLLVDAERRVPFHNQAAANILDDEDGMSLEGGRLTLCPAADSVFAAAWQLAEELCTPQTVCLPRPSGRHCYQLVLGGETHELNGRMIMYLTDPAGDMPDITQSLCRLWGLSAAEATVAALVVEGQDLNQIAAARGVSVLTVRHQMRRIFDKTGARRQVDLVRLILRGVLGSCVSMPAMMETDQAA